MIDINVSLRDGWGLWNQMTVSNVAGTDEFGKKMIDTAVT
jgi:hypothetical protein